MRRYARVASLVALVIALFALPAAARGQGAPPRAGATSAPAAKRAPRAAAQPMPTPGAGPIIVVETSKGTFEFETYPDTAPKTVDHILALVKRGFYNGLRIHRVSPNFVVQLGDPQTRDMSKREWWGRGDFAGSGAPVGTAEISKRHLHTRYAVGLAHPGDATMGDAQFYIMLAPAPRLDGKYTVFGKVISGVDVLPKLQVADLVRKVYVKPVPAT